MYAKIFIYAISALALAVFQAGLVSALPSWLGETDLVLTALVLILGFAGARTAYFWALGAGWILDVLSFAPFGANIAGLLLAAVLADFLLSNLFTNRSLYSFLMLGAIADACYEFCSYFYLNIALFRWPDIFFDAGFFLQKAYGLGANLVLIGTSLYLISHFGASLKPVFLKQESLKPPRAL